MSSSNRRGALALLLATVLAAGPAVAPLAAQTTPGRIAFRGRVTYTGTATGTPTLTFSIFNDQFGGNLLWAETRTDVIWGNNGVFYVELGAAAAIDPAAVFTGGERWLEIAVQVGNDPQVILTPRERLVTVPYAANTRLLDGRPLTDFLSKGALATYGFTSGAGVVTAAELSSGYSVKAQNGVWAQEGGNLRVDGDVALDTGKIALGRGPFLSLDGKTGGIRADGSVTAKHFVGDGSGLVNPAVTEYSPLHKGTLWVGDSSNEAQEVALSAAGDATLSPVAGDTTKIQLTITPLHIDSGKLADSAVATSKLALYAVDPGGLAAGAVTPGKMVSAGVSSDKLADGAATNAKIVNVAVDSARLALGAVTADKLTPDAVDSTKILNGAVDSDKLVDGAVPIRKIAANGCSANDTISRNANATDWTCKASGIGAGEIHSSMIAAGAVDSVKIQSGAVQTSKLASGAVDSAALATAGVGTANLATDAVSADSILNGAVTDAKLAEAAVTFDKLGNTGCSAEQAVTWNGAGWTCAYVFVGAGSVDSAKLAAKAVTTSKLLEGAAQTSKLSAGAVDSAALADGSVDAFKVAADAVTATVIRDGAVDSSKLADAAVTRAKLARGDCADGKAIGYDGTAWGCKDAGVAAHSVVTAMIKAGAVESSKILSGAVQSDKLASAAVTPDKLASAAVGTAKLADEAVDAVNIVAGAVQTSKLAAGAVTADAIDDLAVDSTKLAADAVTERAIADGAVGTPELPDGAVTFRKLGESCDIKDKVIAWGPSGWSCGSADIKEHTLDSAKLVAGAVNSYKIRAEAVETPKLALGAVTLAKLKDGAAGPGKLADDAVGASAILNGSVDTAALANGAVGTSKLAPFSGCAAGQAIYWDSAKWACANAVLSSSVNSEKLASGAVDSGKIAAGAVTTAAIADGAVTAAKIADGAVDSAAFMDQSVGSAELAAGAVTRSKIDPSGCAEGQELSSDGSAWSCVNSPVVTGTIDSTNLTAGAVDSSKIRDGAVQSAKLASEAVTTVAIADGAVDNTKLADGAVTNAKLASDADSLANVSDGGLAISGDAVGFDSHLRSSQSILPSPDTASCGNRPKENVWVADYSTNMAGSFTFETGLDNPEDLKDCMFYLSFSPMFDNIPKAVIITPRDSVSAAAHPYLNMSTNYASNRRFFVQFAHILDITNSGVDTVKLSYDYLVVE